MEEKLYIATYNDQFGKGDTIELAKLDLEDVSTHEPEFDKICFYEVKKINVKQTLTIVE